MAAKSGICWDCKTRRVDNSVLGPELCTICLNYADHENMHNDDGHENGTETEGWPMSACMICHPELDNRYTPKRAGHHNTAPKSWSSHKACNHPATPTARAACRKARDGFANVEAAIPGCTDKHGTCLANVCYCN